MVAVSASPLSTMHCILDAQLNSLICIDVHMDWSWSEWLVKGYYIEYKPAATEFCGNELETSEAKPGVVPMVGHAGGGGGGGYQC